MEIDILCVTDDVYSAPLHEQALQCFSDKNCAVMFGLGQLDVSSHKSFTPPKLMLIEAEYGDTLKALAKTFPTNFGWVCQTPIIILQSHVYNLTPNFDGLNILHTIPMGETTNADVIRTCVDVFDVANKIKHGKVVQAEDYANALAEHAKLQSSCGQSRPPLSTPFPKKLV